MDPFAFVLIVCGATAVVALVLSMTSQLSLARRFGQVSLWLTLAAIPVAIAIDVVRMWLGAAGPESKAALVGETISHAMSYGVLVLPCAAIAGLALRRASTLRTKRPQRPH